MNKNPTRIALACLALMFAAGTAAADMLPGERAADVSAIPGVVAEGAKWAIVWADFVTADGMVGTSDGGLLFAQEQTDSIIKLDRDGNEYTYMHADGPGAVSIDAKGRLYAVMRTCTEPLNPELGGCNRLTHVSMLAPEHRLLANSFADGRPLGRLNDLIADGKGGAYFTVRGAYYVSPNGQVSAVADQDIRPNGIMLSPDGRTLYVTNVDEVLAFDVHADGSNVEPARLRQDRRRHGRRRHGRRLGGPALCHGGAGRARALPRGSAPRPDSVAAPADHARVLGSGQKAAVRRPDGRRWSRRQGLVDAEGCA